MSSRDSSSDRSTEREASSKVANPNAESEHGLEGDMGVSSERTGPYDGVEDTGTVGSAKGRTDGASETHPGQVEPSTEEHRQVQEVEENAAELPSHEHVRAANPHPRREDG
jgi:hypothetical protein